MSTDPIRHSLDDRPANTPLSREFYCSEEIFRADLAMIWYRQWVFVAHDCELRDPGNYLTVQIGAYPVFIVRDREGILRAFHNSCRHRGSRICSSLSGTAPRLVCPYHQWTYRLDGRLIAARDMGSDFDPSDKGLKPVHCETVGGYIWVCVADVAPDFEPVRQQMLPYLLPHRLSDAKVAFQSTTIEKANWKLVWENNRECYHCAVNHPELCRTFPEGPRPPMPDGSAPNAAVEAAWTRWEGLGLPSRFNMAVTGQHRIVRMPLIEGAVSFTMDGRAAVQRPLSANVIEPDIGTMLMFHFPSTWNHVLADHAVTFRVLPLSPTETQLTTKWLVHRDAVEGVDYDLRRLTEVWLATNDADKRICEENQLGVSSPAYAPSIYSPIHEAAVVQFQDWYCRQMSAKPGVSGY